MAGTAGNTIELLLPRFLDRLGALVPGPARKGPWIAALSGGPDSAALCLLLDRARRSSTHGGLIPDSITALHVNHGLRGLAGNADQAIAGELAGKLCFEFRTTRLTPPGSLKSVEAWAREARYAAFLDLAEEIGATAVLTGHHKNDQAETVIQRLMWGAGYRGLSGIRPVRPLVKGIPILAVRPLLPFSREEIETLLAEQNCATALDGSNLDTAFQRNRIRLSVLPALQDAMGETEVLDALCHIADTARAIDEMLEKAASKVLEALFLPIQDKQGTQDYFVPFKGPTPVQPGTPGAAMALDLEGFCKLPLLLRHPVLRGAIEIAFGPSAPPFSRHAFETLSAMAESRTSPFVLQLGPDAEARIAEERLVFDRPEDETIPEETPPLHLKIPGKVMLPDGSSITARCTRDKAEAEEAIAKRNPLLEVLDADQAGPALTIRQRRPGDRFQPLGTKGAKKLKTFLMDCKVPRRSRSRLALVCRGDDILWVTGIRIGHACRIAPTTTRYLILEAVENRDSPLFPPASV